MVYQGELVLSAWKKKLGMVCLEEQDDDTTGLPQLRRLVLFRSSIVGQLTEYLQQVSKVCKIWEARVMERVKRWHRLEVGFHLRKVQNKSSKKWYKSDQRKKYLELVARVKERVKRCTDCSLLISIFTSLLLHEENCTRGKWDWKRICSRVSDRSVSWYGREAEVYQTRPAAQERRQKGLRDARNSFWPWDKSWYRRSRHSSSHRYQPMWSLRFTDLTNHIRIVPDISRKRDVDMKLLKLVS